MSPNIHLDQEIYEELGQYGNRDESWNDVLARVLENLDEDRARKDRDERITTHTSQRKSDAKRPLEGVLEDGTTVRHKYRRGDYSGEVIEATVEDGRINVEGDEGPEAGVDTRSPSGAAREADILKRGDDARKEGYNGWNFWEYEDEDGRWRKLKSLKE